MKNALAPLAAALLVLTPSLVQADWKPVEKIATYRVAGTTGIDLYPVSYTHLTLPTTSRV